MASTFYATWTALFDAANSTAWADIARQFDLVELHCRDQKSGLLVYGYDESGKAVWAQPQTGASPNVWIRALGWYFMALVEVLQVFPREREGFGRLEKYFKEAADAIVRAQDGSGGW